MEQFFQWLQDSPLGVAVREQGNLFPVFETIHVIAITIAVGCIIIMDLRLVDLVWTKRPVGRVIGDALPAVWVSFGIAVITGVLLFTSHAVNYWHDAWFVWKFVFMAMAFVNQLVFHALTGKDLNHWAADFQLPVSAKVAGAISLGLWVVIVACGRMIGFTMEV
ncbi:hypothetical protein CCR94_03555 [Rhodoblastus sphagnicola]|uniref:DUF6644 domain-containing protein n=1 Tax=Rhodoblastus sphagnicola TaxID=333368 RepID=A0A2S6NEC1_9HYPH|nr:DUF6644 family protein [Rhodoblastus sphagnicola]MBB4199898.1 site-specific recombinase [Rhodoblastus sphagnicola]PPQ32953.1 hypothetical protein CCR94_03555 [Rhodoblastus sphagnicola]